MSKRGGGFGLGTGGASILVIFVLLCLTTFATLSIVSANADYKLTQRSAEAVSEYYAADLKAVERLAAIDAAVQNRPAGTTAAEHCRTATSGIEGVTVEETADGALLRYAIPMSGTRELRVALALPENGTSVTVASWQTVSTEEWVEENHIDLWDGGAGESAGGLAALPAGL